MEDVNNIKNICKNENLYIVEKMLQEEIDEVLRIGEIENKDVKAVNNEPKEILSNNSAEDSLFRMKC